MTVYKMSIETAFTRSHTHVQQCLILSSTLTPQLTDNKREDGGGSNSLLKICNPASVPSLTSLEHTILPAILGSSYRLFPPLGCFSLAFSLLRCQLKGHFFQEDSQNLTV